MDSWLRTRIYNMNLFNSNPPFYTIQKTFTLGMVPTFKIICTPLAATSLHPVRDTVHVYNICITPINNAAGKFDPLDAGHWPSSTGM